MAQETQREWLERETGADSAPPSIPAPLAPPMQPEQAMAEPTNVASPKIAQAMISMSNLYAHDDEKRRVNQQNAFLGAKVPGSGDLAEGSTASQAAGKKLGGWPTQ